MTVSSFRPPTAGKNDSVILTGQESRLLCALGTLLVAWAIAGKKSSVLSWTSALVIALGVANIFLGIGPRLDHSNLGHYYIGAKYTPGYFDFYRLVASARSESLVGIRDLRNLDRRFAEDPREARLYYFSLIPPRSFDAPERAATDDLKKRCEAEGLFGRVGRDFTVGRLGEVRASALRSDLQRAKLDTDDYGFNGSPFHAALRHLDPTLYARFSHWVFVVNLAFQAGALLVSSFFWARALRWRPGEHLAVLALVVSYWDYTGWSLNGLVTGGWILPVSLSVWALSAKRPYLFGTGVAWAALVKLFPVILLMPVCVMLGRFLLSLWLRRDACAKDGFGPRFALRSLIGFAGGVVLGVVLGSLSGLSWPEFGEKIVSQFQHSGFVGNTVGVSRFLLAVGMHQSTAILGVQFTALLACVLMFWFLRSEEGTDWAYGVVILLAALVWISRAWFNYYTVLSLLLVPRIIAHKRQVGVLLLVLLAVATAMCELDYMHRGALSALSLARVAPYLLLPLVAYIAECRVRATDASDDKLCGRLPLYAGRVLIIVLCLSFAGMAAEFARHRMAAHWFARSERMAAAGDTDGRARCYARIVRLLPRDASARFNLALLGESMGDADAAVREYRHVLELDPKHIDALLSLGVLMMARGENEEGMNLFRRAVEAVPYDERAHFNLGLALAGAGRRSQAAEHFAEALRIDPSFAAAGKKLRATR